MSTRASPHTRGWTCLKLLADDALVGFPAHAGMDLVLRVAVPAHRRLPRTRGDGPCCDSRQQSQDFSIRLPRTRGDGPATISQRVRVAATSASPHTRGWTRGTADFGPVRGIVGFPAHAGMDPPPARRRWRRRWLPRTRGDGPTTLTIVYRDDRASPHTRGWTHVHRHPDGHADGFPAHAGMDPRATAAHPASGGLPRTRGDGPIVSVSLPCLPMASPHTRGWTLGPVRVGHHSPGFPAHAGMDP